MYCIYEINRYKKYKYIHFSFGESYYKENIKVKIDETLCSEVTVIVSQLILAYVIR